MIRSDIARLRWAVSAATAAEVDLVVDLAAEDASLALAAASLGRRTILHATDALAEWRAVFALRPPSIRAFDAAAEGLLGQIADALDAGWRGSCATCGQPFRVSAYRWDDPASADDLRATPAARRGTCAACRASGGRGDVGQAPAGERIDAVEIDPELRAEGDGRWSDRQIAGFNAARRALLASTEPAPVLDGLRIAVAEAAIAAARPVRSARGWWEVAPRQALSDAFAARRLELFEGEAPPRELSLGADTASLRYPGLSVILRRGGAGARGALAALAASAPQLSIALVRIRIVPAGGAVELRSAAIRWAAGDAGAEEPLDVADPNDPVAVSASIARMLVVLNPLLKRGAEIIVDLPQGVEALAGAVAAIGLAGGSVTAITDLNATDRAAGRALRARLPGVAAGNGVPATRRERVAERLEGDALQRRIAELICVRGEPTMPAALLPAYAMRRSADAEIHDPTVLAAELHALLQIAATLPAAGSLARVVAAGEGRCFVDARAERESLATPAGDRLDAAVYAAAIACAGDRGAFEERLAELDASPIAPEPALRAALVAAHLAPSDPAAHAGGATPRYSQAAATARRIELIAVLLRLAPRLGLYAAVSPALADVRSAEGPILESLAARDPHDPNLPLRARSDRATYDQVEAILYRRGKAILLCETFVATAPLAALLLNRHSGIPNDAEVVRLLVAEDALLPLISLRLERDERLARAWHEGNWHALSASRLATFARLPEPRLGDLEPFLGFDPSSVEPMQLDLASLGLGDAPGGS